MDPASSSRYHPEAGEPRTLRDAAAMGKGNRTVAETILPSGHRVVLVQGDLTEEEADALVNAANSYLQHGGGVAGALVRKGGPQIQAESDEWVRRHGPVPTGGVAITGAGRLRARAILHTVGPVWSGGTRGETRGEEQQLAEAIRNTLEAARAQGYERIAMPAISTGIFGFPKERAAPIFWETIAAFAAAHPGEPPREIRVVILDEATLRPFEAAFHARFGGQAAASPA
jgi:O-acetyl-ADP-ribose deacetylase (regulator of RNase III)